MAREHYVYIMASLSKVLYVGVTANLRERAWQHRSKASPGFTARYNINRLVYYERAPDARSAIAREKQVKSWRREKKVSLIESANPEWDDLAEGWFAE